MGPDAVGLAAFSSARAAENHIDTVAGCSAEAGLGRRNGRIFALSVSHLQPHLVAGEVRAGQSLIPQFQDESDT
jgi:hypothetical protein